MMILTPQKWQMPFIPCFSLHDILGGIGTCPASSLIRDMKMGTRILSVCAVGNLSWGLQSYLSQMLSYAIIFSTPYCNQPLRFENNKTTPIMPWGFWLSWPWAGGGGVGGERAQVFAFYKASFPLTIWQVSTVCKSWGLLFSILVCYLKSHVFLL